MFNYFLLPELTNSKLAHTIQSKRFLFYFISLLLNQHVSGLMRSWMQHKQQGPLMKPGRSKCRYGSCYSVNLLRIHICLYSTSKLQLVWSSWWIICHWQTEEGHVASAEVTLVPAEPQRKNSSVEETEGSDEMKTMQSWQQEIKQGLCVEEHAHDKDSSLLHTFWTVLKRMLISWYLTKKNNLKLFHWFISWSVLLRKKFKELWSQNQPITFHYKTVISYKVICWNCFTFAIFELYTFKSCSYQ